MIRKNLWIFGFDKNSSLDFPNGYSKFALAFSYIKSNEELKGEEIYGRFYEEEL